MSVPGGGSSLPPHLITATPRSSRSHSSPNASPVHQSPGSPRHASGTIDAESYIRAYGGDIRRALENIVNDRNNLQSQNAQLWKLIEKQRVQCAQLASDNERLRADREKVNSKLVSAGIEPVAPGKRVPHSSSAVGLGIRSDPPQIRRHNSDQNKSATLKIPDTVSAPTSPGSASPASPSPKMPSPTIPSPNTAQVVSGSALNSSMSTSTSSTSATSIPPGSGHALLPSPPMQGDRRLRHESRIAFPPEVASFMSLADSPKDPTVSSVVPSTSNDTVSSGSTYSQQSPSDSSKSTILPLAAMAEEPESPIAESSHPGSQPTPTMAFTSPRPSMDTATPRQSIEPSHPSVDICPPIDTAPPSQQYCEISSPTPFRLSPSLLPYTRLSIPTSTIFPNSLGRDVLCFIVAIAVRPPNAEPLTWNVAKLLSAFIDLDTRLHARSGKSRKDWKKIVASLPDGKAWKDFAPSKIDQRKAALEQYLQSLLTAPISDKSDLCDFLNTNAVQARANQARKEGYLTKKGKNFGGWKTRYFVLDGPVMEYYEARGGPHLGSIQLTGAQIGRQNRSVDSSSDERDFRHAFLIIEAVKKGAPNRHVLCAESDQERDSWIDMLVRYIEADQQGPPQSSQTFMPGTSSGQSQHPPPPLYQPTPAGTSQGQAPQGAAALVRKRSAIRKSSKDVVVTAAQPLSAVANTDPGSKFAGAPSPSMINNLEAQRQQQPNRVPSPQPTPHQLPHQQHQPSRDLTILTSHTKTSTSENKSPVMPSPSITKSIEAQQRQQHHHQQPPARNLASPTPMTQSNVNNSHQLGLVTSQSFDPSSSGQSEPTPKASKRQSNLPSRPSFTPAYLTSLSNNGLSAPPGYNMDRDRDRKAKSGRFWGFGGGKSGNSGDKASRPVFGVPLADSIAVASVANLPAIIFRCIEYLEAKKAEEEEGIYRLSGSSAVIKGLKDRFDTEGDVNLRAIDERWDLHAIAGLLKTFLRELPSSLLTRELHMRFLAVMDLIDSSARVAELSRLVSELPPPNYALLRALTAHLILIVRNSAINKMTLRNIGIVFSPTLGIPAGIFSELVSHFGAIFDDSPEDDIVNGTTELALDGIPSPSAEGGMIQVSHASGGGEDGVSEGLRQDSQGGTNSRSSAAASMKKRNSMLYHAGGADALLGLSGRSLDPANEGEDSASEADDVDVEEDESEASQSVQSSGNLSAAGNVST